MFHRAMQEPVQPREVGWLNRDMPGAALPLIPPTTISGAIAIRGVMQIQFDNSYATLPDRFFARVAPTPVAAPRLIKINRALAEQLRLDADWLASPEGVAFLAGQSVPHGADPI